MTLAKICIFLLGLVIGSCSATPGGPRVYPAVQGGYTRYCGEDVSGKRFIFAVPTRYSIVSSRTRDEYDFLAKDGDRAVLSFHSEAPKVALAMDREIFATADPKTVTRSKDGAQSVARVEEKEIGGKWHRTGLAVWIRDPSAAGLELRTSRPPAAVLQELRAIVATLHYDASLQSLSDVKTSFGSDVVILGRPGADPASKRD